MRVKFLMEMKVRVNIWLKSESEGESCNKHESESANESKSESWNLNKSESDNLNNVKDWRRQNYEI